jgi:hypothetical protein
MTKTTTLRARSPEDLLAAVPCVLGFRPSDSVVMLTFTGAPPGQTFHARVDLPTDARDHPEVVALLLEPVLRHRVERVAFVLYTDDAAAAAALAEALLGVFEAEGIDVVDVLRADGRRWFGLRPGAATGGPGRPYDDRSHPFRAQAVLDGRVTLESRDELAATLVGTDLAALAAVGAAAEARPSDPRHRRTEARWVRAALVRALDGRSDDRLTDAEVGRLLAACRDVQVRDVAWALMSREDARRHVEVWRDVVRRCPTDLLAAPASLLAFAAWLAGDGALAWCALDRCALADPDYRMAGLVAHTLEQALPPSVWTPLPESALPVLDQPSRH